MKDKKIESMLSQLIKMVESIQSEQQEMKQGQQEIKQELQGLKQEQQGLKQELQGLKQVLQEIKHVQLEMQTKLQSMESIGEKRHKEILDRFTALENDQDFIWEKTARNEREIANIKRRLS